MDENNPLFGLKQMEIYTENIIQYMKEHNMTEQDVMTIILNSEITSKEEPTEQNVGLFWLKPL